MNIIHVLFVSTSMGFRNAAEFMKLFLINKGVHMFLFGVSFSEEIKKKTYANDLDFYLYSI